jgi:hypothetical protein
MCWNFPRVFFSPHYAFYILYSYRRLESPAQPELFTMSRMPAETSPLGRLVLFLTCLTIIASIVAGAWVYAVELPAQEELQPPTNSRVCGPHYDANGNVIAYTCCDKNGIPEECRPML